MIELNSQGRQLAFDQWRIVHLAEFGIYTFGGRGGAPPTPGLNFLDKRFCQHLDYFSTDPSPGEEGAQTTEDTKVEAEGRTEGRTEQR